MKLLICGDSYSYNHNNRDSWVTRFSNDNEVINLSQCGIGQYKIYKQLSSVELTIFDKIIIFHTSPNRVHINSNSMHKSPTHENCDLIFSDVESKKEVDSLARVAYEYFVNVFDLEYYEYIHNLICKDIHNITKNLSVLHCTAFDYKNLYSFDNKIISFYDIWKQNRGLINHFNVDGNSIIYDKITKLVKNEI